MKEVFIAEGVGCSASIAQKGARLQGVLPRLSFENLHRLAPSQVSRGAFTDLSGEKADIGCGSQNVLSCRPGVLCGIKEARAVHTDVLYCSDVTAVLDQSPLEKTIWLIRRKRQLHD